jgi:acetyl-CoA C-acetyltransferase
MTRGADLFVTGWGHTRFGRLEGESLESLVVTAARAAIADAGLEPGQIDAVYLGTFNAGIEPLAFASSLALQVSADMFGVPATRVENACASGAAALHQALTHLLAGRGDHVLVVGAEKMSHASTAAVGDALLGADYDHARQAVPGGFVGLFAQVARAYEDRYGSVGDVLARIASRSHHNAMANPYAHLHKELDVEFCREVSDANPMIAAPLRRTDCSPVSDGAAAVVVSSRRRPGAAHGPVRVRSFAQANDFLPAARRDPLAFAASARAWNDALGQAGVSAGDLDLVELHDCFTIAELNLYEAFGLAERGAGTALVHSGDLERGGRLPVNVSGGLKSKGHPVGATGVSQIVMGAMQLSGTAGAMQLPAPRLAAIHNMGGLAIANHVTVLEACG